MNDEHDKARAHNLAKRKLVSENHRAERAVILRYVGGTCVLVTLVIAGASVSCRYIHRAMPLDACQSCWDTAGGVGVGAVEKQANMDRCIQVCADD